MSRASTSAQTVTSTKFSCSRCDGVFGAASGTALPTCAHGGLMAPVPSTTRVSGCLDDVANFVRLPAMKKRHFVPRTGRGKFDVEYDPTSGRLDVLVVLNMATATKWFYETDGFTASDLLQMKRDLQEGVPRYWDAKFRFVCRKPGFGALPMVTPRFRIEYDVPLGSHFKLIVALPDKKSAENTRPEMRNCRGFVSLNQVVSNDPSVQDRVELLDFHLRDFESRLHPSLIARAERERLQAALPAVGTAATEGTNKWIFIGFDAIGAGERGVLQNFARAVVQRVKGTMRTPLIVSGVRLASEAPGKSREREDAVETALNTIVGFDNPITHAPGIVGPAAGVRIRVDTDYEDTVAGIDYNVAAHEFGHMLGLPDEYENPVAAEDSNPDDVAKATVKRNYTSLLTEANIPAPTFPSYTASMMSWGMTIQPFHAVTLWDALCFLTRRHIRPDHWEVMMV